MSLQKWKFRFQSAGFDLCWNYCRLFFTTGFFTFMMRQTIIVASRRIEYELKNKIYRHYQDLSLTDYKQTTIGDLMNRLSEDVVAVRMSWSWSNVCGQPDCSCSDHRYIW
jgi:ABC-type multidrug transport system fused ATPase/permease subunit